MKRCAKCGDEAVAVIYFPAHDDVSEHQCRRHAYEPRPASHPIIRMPLQWGH